MKPISRRGFFAIGAGSAAAGWAISGEAAENWREKNPFGYDIGRHARVDPKLLNYEQVTLHKTAVDRPRRVALGTEGRLYVAMAKGILVLDAKSGDTIKEIPLPEPTRCVTVDKDGGLWAGMRRAVVKIDAQGSAKPFCEQTRENTWFTAIAVGGDDVFVADSGGRVILRYDREGKLTGKIGGKDPDRNVPGLIVPSPYLDVKLAADGLLRVNNPGRHRVELYTRDGDLELTWGQPAIAIEGFCGCCNPVALVMLPDGSCVTCEKGLPRVKVSSPEGKLLSVVAGPESFPENAKAGGTRDPLDGTMGGLDAAVDAEGRIYILDVATRQIRVMRKKGTDA